MVKVSATEPRNLAGLSVSMKWQFMNVIIIIIIIINPKDHKKGQTFV